MDFAILELNLRSISLTDRHLHEASSCEIQENIIREAVEVLNQATYKIFREHNFKVISLSLLRPRRQVSFGNYLGIKIWGWNCLIGVFIELSTVALFCYTHYMCTPLSPNHVHLGTAHEVFKYIRQP